MDFVSDVEVIIQENKDVFASKEVMSRYKLGVQIFPVFVLVAN